MMILTNNQEEKNDSDKIKKESDKAKSGFCRSFAPQYLFTL